jgi:hypothetical protein
MSESTVHVTLTVPDALELPAVAFVGKAAKAATVSINNPAIIMFFMGITSHISVSSYLKYISAFRGLD